MAGLAGPHAAAANPTAPSLSSSNPEYRFTMAMTAGAPAGDAVAVSKERSRESRQDPERWVWNVPEPLPGVRHGEVHSRAMNRTVGYNIYLPPSYEREPARRYPVVYYLHGATGNERSDAGFHRVVAGEIDAGTVGEVIYVFPNGGPFSSYADWPDSYVKAETWIVQELIPYIDQHYRTLGTRVGRAAMGYSMGGGGSVRLAMKHPDLFGAVAAMAGAFGGGPGSQPDDSALAWSTLHADQIRGRLPLHFVVGDRDRLLNRHHHFLAHLDELDIEYSYIVHADVGHSLGKLTELSGPHLVRWLSRHYAPATEERAP